MDGLSSARNAGLEIANGEYISFIDSDDCVSLNFIERMYCTLKENDADIVQCSFSRNKSDIDKGCLNNVTEILSSEQAIKKLNDIKYHADFVIVCNKLYKAYIYKNLSFPIGRINEDEFTTYLALDRCDKMVVIPDKMYYYRVNSNSIMQKSYSTKRYDALVAFENEIEYFKNNQKYNSYKSATVLYQHMLKVAYMLTFRYLEENKKTNLEMLLKKIRKNMKNFLKYSNDNMIEKIKHIIFYIFPNFYSFLMVYVVERIKYAFFKGVETDDT